MKVFVSGKPRRRRIACVSALLSLLSVTAGAYAFELNDVLHPALLADPLRVSPRILKDGAILPDDDRPIACAVDGPEQSELTLEAAIDQAMCSNPQVRAAWAAIKVQAGAVGEAQAAYLPTLTGSLTRLNDTTWFPGGTAAATKTSGNTVYAALAWRLLDFGGRAANLQSAKSLLAASMATHDATLQKTLTSVIQAYFDAQTAGASVTAKHEAVSIASSTVDTAKHKEARGAGAASDTLQAETTLARATLDLSRAEGDLRKAKALLVYAIGAPPSRAVSLVAMERPHEQAMAQSLTDWLSEAQLHHPAIAAARAQVDAARARADATRSDGLPSLDFSASFYQNGRPGQGLSTVQTRERIVGVTLNIPIFEGFGRTYKIEGADALIEQRSADLQDVAHRVAMEVIEAYSDAQAALKNLDASDALLTTARSSLASSQRKYEKGAADVLEILSTQKALADAQQERIRCVAEWRSSSLRVIAAAGQLGVSKINVKVHSQSY